MIPVGTSVNAGELRSGPKWEKTFISCLGVPDTSPGTHLVYRNRYFVIYSHKKWENVYLMVKNARAGPLPKLACFPCLTPLCYIDKILEKNLGHSVDKILDPLVRDLGANSPVWSVRLTHREILTLPLIGGQRSPYLQGFP